MCRSEQRAGAARNRLIVVAVLPAVPALKSPACRTCHRSTTRVTLRTRFGYYCICEACGAMWHHHQPQRRVDVTDGSEELPTKVKATLLADRRVAPALNTDASGAKTPSRRRKSREDDGDT